MEQKCAAGKQQVCRLAVEVTASVLNQAKGSVTLAAEVSSRVANRPFRVCRPPREGRGARGVAARVARGTGTRSSRQGVVF